MTPFSAVVLGLLFTLGNTAYPQPANGQPAGQSPTPAQPSGSAQPSVQTPPPAQADPAKQPPPALVLRDRVERVRQSARLGDTVVIVSDADSYLEAISRWTIELRFPILIDDGSPESREDIARFVRGYRPAKVVRWALEKSPRGVGAPSFENIDRAALHVAMARAWGIPLPTEPLTGDAQADQARTAFLESCKASGFAPVGLVLVDTSDPAWTAGLALAAGHGQVLATTAIKNESEVVLWPHEGDRWAKAAQDAAEASGCSWRALSDDLDMVTICADMPVRLATDKGEFFAFTDRIGRFGKGLEATERWAYGGHILGNASRATYNAMCALFLQPDSAFLFDGYDTSEPWNQYDCTAAERDIKAVGLATELFDHPRGSAQDWKGRTRRALSAGLILVNSKGNADFFELQPGRCTPDDVPLLAVPAMMHIVHSWSATTPAKRDTVAGRFLERGVYLYTGSVHEPYLTAFVPTPLLTKRLLSGAPFACAITIDGRPLGKLVVLGDPLRTIGPAMPRVKDAPELPGAKDVVSGLRDLIDREQYADAFLALSLSGRDDDIAKLTRALLVKKPGAIAGRAAREAVMPLARIGDVDSLRQVFDAMPAGMKNDPVLRDAFTLITGAAPK